MTRQFNVLVSSSTPLPLVEAARDIADAIRARGEAVEVVEDALPSAADSHINVVLAPEEVYPHLEIEARELDRSLASTILIGAARPSGRGWTRTLPYAERAGAVLDVSDAGVTAFASAGIRAERFRLGAAPSQDPEPGSLDTRPLDVVFLGTSTQRRLRMLASAAPHLSRRDVDLRLTEGIASRNQRVDGFVTGQEKMHLLRSAKVALNMHPGDDPLFEWLRARDALASGCLLVSELSSGATPLDPGRHFVSVDHGHLGATVDRLLDEQDRLDGIRMEGATFFRDSVRLQDEVTTLLDAAAALPARRRRRTTPLAAPGPDPATPPEVTTPEEQVLSAVTRQNAVLKRLFVEIRNLRREIAHVRHSVEDPTEPLVRVTSTPGWESGGSCDVTVIISLHNYGRFVDEAIESSLASEGIRVEIVIVDDRSTDDGPAVVHRLMTERPDAAIRFLEQRVNTGVQRARNLAFSHARAEYAFVLDADNVVYPRGLAKLRDALQSEPEAAFAYGIIERFDDQGGTGLMGLEGWDERRLARSHYIDAMALVRVDAWREVGGYVTDPALELGWEDYDLWLNFASHGYRGTHVREIIGRYRVHGVSSLAITTLDTTELMGRLQARHARFFRQSGNLS